MNEFKLVPSHIHDFHKKYVEDLMYEIKGNELLIKQILEKKIAKEFKDSSFEISQIKQLKVFVSKDNYNDFTELWLDFDTHNDLCLITRIKDLKINDLQTIKNIVACWLLSE